jgi:hypothetical protein
MLINTSLNINEQPIVNSPLEALLWSRRAFPRSLPIVEIELIPKAADGRGSPPSRGAKVDVHCVNELKGRSGVYLWLGDFGQRSGCCKRLAVELHHQLKSWQARSCAGYSASSTRSALPMPIWLDG